MLLDQVMAELDALADKSVLKNKTRAKINIQNSKGVTTPKLRALAKKIGKDHSLAHELWATKIHEARILSAFVAEPVKVTSPEMDIWVSECDSWDLCDALCANLFDKTPFAYEKALKWHNAQKEFEKRAGFVMMAVLAVHDKKASDLPFIEFLDLIKKQATDERNFVKKAVNWALRQIGKRNLALNRAAIEKSQEIKAMDFPSAKWIANDAIRELTSEKVLKRLKAREQRG